MWPRKAKYGNKKTVMADGTRMDSKGEARRYAELLFLQEQGIIRQLERQVRYKLYGRGGTEICALVVDFSYFEDSQLVVEDWKGVRTAAFNIKAKMFADNYPGVLLRLSGPHQKIRDKANAKARGKRAAKKTSAKSPDFVLV